MTGIVVDTSAIVAILTGEPGRDWLVGRLAAASDRVMAAPTALELGIVLEGRTPEAGGIARRAVHEARISVIPFDEALVERAMTAWWRYGRGRHAAALNLGDCFTFALADHTGYPVLCVGDDFRRTDLAVLHPPVP